MKFTRLSKARQLLPWYAAGQLSSSERQFIEACLSESQVLRDELAWVQQMGAALKQETLESPSPLVQKRIWAAIAASPRPASAFALYPRLAASLLLTLALLMILWVVIKPGVVLAWQANGEALTTYRLYRAPVNSAHYTLIEEVRARSGISEYRYADAFLLPGQVYSYVVEGVKEDGRHFTSETITVAAGQALPAQLSLLLFSAAMGYLLFVMAQNPTIWQVVLGRRRV